MDSARADFASYFEDFRGIIAIPATASPDGRGWTKADTSAAGSPTLASVTPSVSGEVAGILDSTNEVQNLCLYHGDVLNFSAPLIQWFETKVKASASLNAAISIAFGLTGARNDTIDTIAYQALFRLIGSNTLYVESDDGVNDRDDVATGLSLDTTYRRFAIDFQGGLSALKFFAEGSDGALKRVARSTTFDLSNYTGGLQPFFQIQKTAAAAVGSFTVDYVAIDSKRR
ncbi:MAG TPA: hypothetical protein VGE52_14765 [Pirellulales bacterium]